MTREDLRKLELSDEQITGVMKLKSTAIGELEKKIETLNEEKTNLQNQIDTANETIKRFEDKEQFDLKEKALQERIEKTFGESQFINELTKKALVEEMKKAINDETNVGKSDSEIFNELTKDQNVFVNPNKPVEIPNMGTTEATNAKEMPIVW